MSPFSLIPSSETPELADDIRELFDDLSRALPRDQRAYSGECRPTLDVLELEDAVEVTIDMAGVPAAAIRVLFRAGVLLIVGEKAPSAASGEQLYHLVEREFGRFARGMRLSGAFDIAGTRATLREGELTIVLPKILDRRGAPHHIRVSSAGQSSP